MLEVQCIDSEVNIHPHDSKRMTLELTVELKDLELNMEDSIEFIIDQHADDPSAAFLEEFLSEWLNHVGDPNQSIGILIDKVVCDNTNIGTWGILDAIFNESNGGMLFEELEDVLNTWISDNRPEVPAVPHHCPHCGMGAKVVVYVQSIYTCDRTGLPMDSEQLEQTGYDGKDQFKVICNAQRGGCGASGGIGRDEQEAIHIWNGGR